MQARAHDKAVLGSFAALTVMTIGLKVLVDVPEVYPSPGSTELTVVNKLRTQGFKTKTVNEVGLNTMIYAERGPCRVAARDALNAGSEATLFAHAARGVGPVRYLYKNQVYATPPNFHIFADHVEQRVLTALGLRRSQHISIALASSPNCGTGSFHLGDVELQA